jgi:beta-glucanase (GH16 family)
MRTALALLCLLALPLAASAQGDMPEGWVLVWQEDFDARDAAFDARWDIGTHTFDGNVAQFVPQNVVVADGLLTLRLTAQPAGDRSYSGAELRTDNQTGFFRYGRFEARMKAARGSGVISSLFTYRYAPWQEVDIEFKGRNTRAMQANIFYNEGGENAPYEVPPFPEDAPLPFDAADAFHVYAFEWEPGIIRWFVDGEQVLESQNPAEVPYLPQQLMMNLWATNAPWAGPFDASALPAEAQYDWVRVYRRDAGLVFDTFDDGDLSDVFTFSETGGGIGVGPTTDASGVPNRAVNVGLDPAGAGGYAGVVFAGDPGTTDVSGAAALTFQLRPSVQAANLPLTLEVNLHEDVNGNGVYDGAIEDEYQALYTVVGASGYTDVTIPLSAFTDDNSVFPGANDGFDYARLLEIVVAIVGPTGPGYSLSFDEVAFTALPTSGEAASDDGPEVALLPNPTRGAAMVVLSLAEPASGRVEVFDVLGRRVATTLVPAGGAGEVRVPLALTGLVGGTYVVRVTVGDRVWTHPLTVVR